MGPWLAYTSYRRSASWGAQRLSRIAIDEGSPSVETALIRRTGCESLDPRLDKGVGRTDRGSVLEPSCRLYRWCICTLSGSQLRTQAARWSAADRVEGGSETNDGQTELQGRGGIGEGREISNIEICCVKIVSFASLSLISSTVFDRYL